jgi:hypothetical protein
MVEINDKGLFQDLRTGLKYHEITREMIEGCLDDEIDNAYEPYIDPQTQVILPQSVRLKTLDPKQYSERVIEYMEWNKIIALDCEEGVRYFEFDEDENDVR